MDAKELVQNSSAISDIVTARKVDAVSAGIVKDDESQKLSVLTKREDALGVRASRKRDKANRTARAKQAMPASSSGAEPKDLESSNEYAEPTDAKDKALRARQIAMREAVSELDDTDEFEGAQGAYDAGRTTKRAASYARNARKSDAASAAGKVEGSAKRASALGAKKPGAARASGASGAQAQATQHAAAQAAGTAAKASASTSGSTAVAGTLGGSGLAAAGGVLCGVIAFVLIALLVGQMVSALFGFWDAEDKKRSMEGLPPYITYEMVEEALACQKEYGHPAGCTIAQIIVESGQGDHLSGLATQDHNLFGMKWSSAYALCEEVAGKSSWRTGEEYDGEQVTITADFISFVGDAECIRFRSRVFLQAERYASNALIREAIANHDSDKMAEGLKNAGWATSSSYVESLKSVMETYNLYRFDGMSLEDFRSGALSADAIVSAAYSQLGVPYVWGGTTPGVGLDCSGLTQYCYKQAGISIPRNTEAQYAQGKKIALSEAQPGDVLYRAGHVGIYIGGDQYIHAPHRGEVVKIASGISSFTCALSYR